MRKIAEQKALEEYPIKKERIYYGLPLINGAEPFTGDVNIPQRNAYIQGYDQAMQDFLGWLKDCSTFTYSNGYKRIDDDLYNKLVEDFKNYMQDESEKQ